MKIVKTKYILTPDKIISDRAVAFDEKIVDIDEFEILKEKYPDAKIVEYENNSCLLPGFINSHVHLEFSANKASLSYGDFIIWLNSVIKKREELIPKCDEDCLKNAIDTMLKSGITSFGAVSSYGYDMNVCSQAPQRVVYFNEIIGSNPAAADVLYNDFIQRVKESIKLKDEKFIPAIAIHSPYSVHRVLVEKAIEFAKKNSFLISTHFMESRAEREWLDKATGDFKAFFEDFLNQSIPANRALDFLEMFNGTNSLFVHTVWCNEKELEIIEKNRHSIIHCPVSNRLLGNGALDIGKIKYLGINFLTATDGLSSNYSLNLYEELKSALFVHYYIDPNVLAMDLIRSVTKNAAAALKLNCGEIEIGKYADLQIVELPEDLDNLNEIPLNIILHTKKVKNVFISGEMYE
ncbi:aminofutalosine deaminase family hydrolase [Nitrosophilus kaiyonis]|uniref:aminofutalosine deaminase family hydrolase n=1 Tax=Nitrosophilus kaiyonis TaxID=2930200 RepID=UPI002490CF0A|nr:metal-dependent hydrolase [Nitrosophilus kaiyonis]